MIYVQYHNERVIRLIKDDVYIYNLQNPSLVGDKLKWNYHELSIWKSISQDELNNILLEIL